MPGTVQQPRRGFRKKSIFAIMLAAVVTAISLGTVSAFADTTGCSSPGYLDVASRTSISGWARDCDRPSDSAQVHIYVNGTFWKAVTANDPRGDLGGNFGFHIDNHGLAPGARIDAYLIGVNAQGGGDGNNPKLGNAPRTIPTAFDLMQGRWYNNGGSLLDIRSDGGHDPRNTVPLCGDLVVSNINNITPQVISASYRTAASTGILNGNIVTCTSTSSVSTTMTLSADGNTITVAGGANFTWMRY